LEGKERAAMYPKRGEEDFFDYLEAKRNRIFGAIGDGQRELKGKKKRGQLTSQ